ncbi:MAG: nucleotidyltransferase domain-containing protein [Bacteroidetes bacterium]|nr:nucleotidyltransferase domain-containing protein [Bacteroidota bacterium]
MKNRIEQEIKRIEEQYKVKVLFACETGSRAWGFPSPDSDYDVRMLYKHESDWYLSINEKDETIEYMSEDKEIDVSGWDIRKSLQLLRKSNGALLERIQSPIVYRATDGFVEIFREAAERSYIPIATMHHYLNMAKSSFRDIEHEESTKLKRLFYALRGALACKWILDKDVMPPIEFKFMLDELAFDFQIKARIKELIELKSGKNEDYIHPREVELITFIKMLLDEADAKANTLAGRQDKYFDLDEVFRKLLKDL